MSGEQAHHSAEHDGINRSSKAYRLGKFMARHGFAPKEPHGLEAVRLMTKKRVDEVARQRLSDAMKYVKGQRLSDANLQIAHAVGNVRGSDVVEQLDAWNDRRATPVATREMTSSAGRGFDNQIITPVRGPIAAAWQRHQEVREIRRAGEQPDDPENRAKEADYRRELDARVQRRQANITSANTVVNPGAAEAAAKMTPEASTPTPEPFDPGVKRVYEVGHIGVEQQEGPVAGPVSGNPDLERLIQGLHSRGVGTSPADHAAARELRSEWEGK